jgi:signal peptidase I
MRHAVPWGRVAVAGRSMEPTLRDGDWLVVRWSAAAVRPGRLVVVRLPGGPLSVKRALRRTPEGWWVERDNPREGVDSWQVGAVPPDGVLGVVVLRYRPLSRLRYWPPCSRS